MNQEFFRFFVKERNMIKKIKEKTNADTYGFT